jgi:hypothetical protein
MALHANDLDVIEADTVPAFVNGNHMIDVPKVSRAVTDTPKKSSSCGIGRVTAAAFVNALTELVLPAQSTKGAAAVLLEHQNERLGRWALWPTPEIGRVLAFRRTVVPSGVRDLTGLTPLTNAVDDLELGQVHPSLAPVELDLRLSDRPRWHNLLEGNGSLGPFEREASQRSQPPRGTASEGTLRPAP